MKMSARSRSAALTPTATCSERLPCATSRYSRRSSTTDRSRPSKGAIRHHLNAVRSARRYDPKRAGIDRDLTRREMGPIEPVLARLDRELVGGIHLTESQIDDLTQFVTTGLLDRRALKENLCTLVPRSVPSRLPVLTFEACNVRATATEPLVSSKPPVVLPLKRNSEADKCGEQPAAVGSAVHICERGGRTCSRPVAQGCDFSRAKERR